MVSCGMNFSLSCHLVDRIKPRDHLRSEMGWEEVGNLKTHEFFHTIIRENILTPIYRENSKNISAEEHIAIGQIRQCFLTLPLTESQIALWWDFVSFFFFLTCFVFQRTGSTWFWSSWKWGYKAEGISCVWYIFPSLWG